jgi:hypothetical protein
MRLAVIGNSHLAMLKLSWDRIAVRHPAVGVRFFGAGAHAVAACEVHDGRLEPPEAGLAKKFAFTSGGLTAIAFEDYDALVYCGLLLDVPRLDARMSAAVREAAIAGAVQAAVSVDLAARVRAVSGIPQVIIPNPLFAARPEFIPSSHRMLAYASILEAIALRIAGKVGQVTVIGQPEALVRPDLLTDLIWKTGSTRLATSGDATGTEGHTRRDVKHMNADFGEHVWSDLLPRLQALLPAQHGEERRRQAVGS